MEFLKTDLSGVYLIRPVRHGDSRGYFCETFRQDEFDRNVGHVIFVQDNESRSFHGVARGLHYQAGDASQAKLVRVTEGRVIDYALDLRRDSPTYGRHIAVELSADNGLQLFIPRGFAHGFIVMSETAVFQYKVDNPYNPQSERCIRFDDKDVAVDFSKIDLPLVFSEKDRNGLSFSEAEKF